MSLNSSLWRGLRRPAPPISIRLPRPNSTSRTFTSSLRQLQHQQQQPKDQDQDHQRHQHHQKKSARDALRDTKVVWRPIPIALGIAFLAAFQFYRVQKREKARADQEQDWEQDRLAHQDAQGDDDDAGAATPKKRQRIRPSGPWSVQIMSTLPLKALSRVWGRFNELEIPYYLRLPGFKLYSFIFGVNLDEVSEPDLHVYPNLASFFYRTLKPGVRPLDPNPNALLSPADGKVIQFGTIEHGEVEQVKGVTYSLDALLGAQSPTSASPAPTSNIQFSPNSPHPSPDRTRHAEEEVIRADEEFAKVNGISYTLPNLFSGSKDDASSPESSSASSFSIFKSSKPRDQSTSSNSTSEAEVRADLARSPAAQRPWWAPSDSPTTPTALYYLVVYLAPGDYHRFHSPCAWVVESRRHFAGELYSVSPYLQRTMPGLFTLNERVVLLGRWRWGFFSYTPVGATNVGSIKINFDRELRTNSLTTDTEADRAAEAAANQGKPYSGFAEATYGGANALLNGHALKRGEEMGGFQLGSTIVLVFEAPKGRRPTFDEGWTGPDGADERKGGWKWAVKTGQKVQVGQAVGWVDVEDDQD